MAPHDPSLDLVARSLRALTEADNRRFETLPRQFLVLNFLGAGRPDRFSTGEIAEALGISKPAVSRALSQLRQRGHVQNGTAAKDARRNAASSTKGGQAYLKRVADCLALPPL